MTSHRFDITIWDWRTLVVVIAAVGAAVCSAVGCDDSGSAPSSAPGPWHFDSATAPYAIDVPAEWERTSADKLNEYADFAASIDHRYYVIVILQKLPQYEGVRTPDAAAIKRAALGTLRKRVDGFEIERQGPLRLADQPALSVFAEGNQDGQPIQYVTTYVAHGNWGYQIVAWGSQTDEDELVEATDALMAGWEFTEDPAAGASSAPDAEIPAASPDAGRAE